MGPEPLSFINDFSYLLAGDDKQERAVTRQEIEDARTSLLRVSNPVGKHMLHYLSSFEQVRRAYHTGRFETEIGLLLIACRLFRDQHGQLPLRLSELVDAKLLDSVPIDPFSGQEVPYDSQRRLIGAFGTDDGESADDFDLVWRIPAEGD